METSLGDPVPGECRAVGLAGGKKGRDKEEDIHWQQRIRERDQVGMTQQCAVLGMALGCPGMCGTKRG